MEFVQKFVGYQFFRTALNSVFCSVFVLLSKNFASLIQNATSYGLEQFFFFLRNKQAKFSIFNTIIEPIFTNLFLFLTIAKQIIAVGHWRSKKCYRKICIRGMDSARCVKSSRKIGNESLSEWVDKTNFQTKTRAHNKQKLAR